MQVSIWLVRGLISAVERAGASREQFLKLAGLAPELLDESQARLSVGDYERAMKAALDVTEDPALGLHMGERAGPEMYHLVAHLSTNASTLGQSIAMIHRYSAILAVGFEPRLSESGDRATLHLPRLVGDTASVRLTAEFALTGLLRMLRQYVGPSARALRVCFAYPAPKHAAEYRRIFEGAECFDQPETELEFPRSWLDRSQLYKDAELHHVLQSHAERELARVARGITTRDRVQDILAARGPRDLPTMDEVARELGVSVRTLARKLGAESVTYGTLLETSRALAAKRLLEGASGSIQEAAYAMGFQDAPAFHRAFKRWTGLTPKQYLESV